VCLILWIVATFGDDLSFDQVVFHCSIGLDGLQGCDKWVINSFIEKSVFLPVKIIIIYQSLLYTTKRIQPESASKFFLNIFLSIQKSILRINVLISQKSTSVFLFLLTLIFAFIQLKVSALIGNMFGKDYFSLYYVEPSNAFIAPTKKKNLLLIYVESLETSLTNEEVHGENLLQPIDDLEGKKIENFVQVPGATCTIAGMVASQCSIPLKFGSFNLRFFLPGVKCLGDILAQNNYEQYFLVGHNVKFDRMDVFYREHGYQNLIGKDQWEQMGLSKDLFSSWGSGLHDDTLLAQAKKIIEQASSKEKPFNITLITADNHFPHGHPSPRCHKSEMESGFQGAYKCSSRFIADFIEELKREKLLNNTVVVITGDHLFMSTRETDKFFSNPRHVYAKFIYNDSDIQPLRDKITHFDIAPSILQLLGFVSPSGDTKFGLGSSIFATVENEEYNQILKNVASEEILNFSTKYAKFFIPPLKDSK
jgi:phosphoglycerol transferase